MFLSAPANSVRNAQETIKKKSAGLEIPLIMLK